MDGGEVVCVLVFVFLVEWFREGRLLGWSGGLVVAVEGVLICFGGGGGVHGLLITI